MHHGTAIQTRRPPGGRLFGYTLAATIFLGCLVLWLGIPLVALWIVSQITAEAGMFLLLLLVVCPVLMAAFALMLVRLNAVYEQFTGADDSQMRAAWLKSLSGERAPRRPPAVLETSMIVSVAIALVLMLVFFLFFAENYSPAPIAP